MANGEQKRVTIHSEKDETLIANTGNSDSEREVQQLEIKESTSRQERSKQKQKRKTRVKRVNDAIIKKNGWARVRHPDLPMTTPPRYYANEDGDICLNSSGKLRPLKFKPKVITGYFRAAENKVQPCKLVEIMAYTFSDHYDRNKHHITYKDGNPYNRAWYNITICEDMFTLQQEEIDRLERLHPGKKYTVVRNVHDTLTFERYLVSDAGEIYSLITRKHLKCHTSQKTGYVYVQLKCDGNAEEANKGDMVFVLQSIVMQSFRGRRPETTRITHLNNDKCDNSLKNLEYNIPTIGTRAPLKKTKQERNKGVEVTPPPITDELEWKTIGVLPWNGQSFSQHEVSNMGHVRNKTNHELVKLSRAPDGYSCVYLRHDQQSLQTMPRQLLVARLVAHAFVDGYNDKKDVVQHLNGNRLDNGAQNLKWSSKMSSAVQRRSRPVVVSLVDDPEMRKEYPSIKLAQRGMSFFIYPWIKKHGDSFTKPIDWDGEKRMALIQVLRSERDKDKDEDKDEDKE